MKWKKIMALLLTGIMLSSNTIAYASEIEEVVADPITADMVDVCLATAEEDLTPYATTYDYNTELKKFPSSYQSLLEKLHESYPNWVFVAVDTGLNWNDVVAGESYGTRSFLQTTYADILLSKASADYNVSTGKYVIRDGSTWVNASDPAIAYFVDPRNYLNKQYIFAMEDQGFNSDYQTVKAIESILSGTDLANKEIVYTNTAGKKVSLAPLTYAQAILAAGKSSGVSPLFLASKIRQETGAKLTNGSISGTFSYGSKSYKGYYNFYNIGAYATSTGSAVANGLEYAKKSGSYQRPWDSPVKAIQGGAESIASGYVKKGQNTGYFQKFNTVYSPYYQHQYMQNIAAAMSEGRTTYNSYNSLDMLNNKFVFFIPVYKNMPSRTAAIHMEKSSSKGTILSAVNLRKGPSASYEKITLIPKDATVAVSEIVFTDDTVTTSSKLANPYWAKVTYGENTGYIIYDSIQMNTGLEVKRGETLNILLTEAPEGEKVYYETSNPAIATVDNKGVISGVKSGRCMVFAVSSSGKRMDIAGVKVSTSLSQPNLLEVVNKSQGIRVTWQQVSGADGYKVYRKTSDKEFSLLTTIEDGEILTYTDSSAKSGVKYTYAVSAYDSEKESSYDSKGMSVTRLSQPVLGEVKTLSSNKLKVTWNKVEGAEGYYVYRKVEGGTWSKIQTIKDPDKLYFNNAYLNANTTYYYSVSAYADGIRSTYLSKGISGKTSEAKYVTYKTTAKVNYRTGAGTSYNKIGTLAKGAKIQVEDGYSRSANGYTWYRFKKDSKTYYVTSNYLKKVTETTSTETPKTYTTYKTTAKVNYRTGAGTSYSKAGTLAIGTKIQVEDGYSKKANGYTWYRFKKDSKTYYVTSNYLKKVIEEKKTYTSYRTTTNVFYRTGAGTSYSKAGRLYADSKIQVEDGYSKKANGYTWYRFKMDSKTYYVASKYLKKE